MNAMHSPLRQVPTRAVDPAQVRWPVPPEARFAKLDTVAHLVVLVPLVTSLMTITIVLLSAGGGLL